MNITEKIDKYLNEGYKVGQTIKVDGESVEIVQVDKKRQAIVFKKKDGQRESRGFEELTN